MPLLGGIEIWAAEKPEAYNVGSYDSLAELNEEWEAKKLEDWLEEK